MCHSLLSVLIGSCLCIAPLARADVDLAQQILEELIASNTAPSGGNDMSEAIGILSGHLLAAGFDADDLTVVAPNDGPQNLVVRLESPEPTKEPILLMAHLDVVEALRSDWTVEPYRLIEKDGYFYGRGTVDNKAGAATIVANLVRLKREGYAGNRDLIAMLTGDEETTGDGARWLANEGRHLIDAEFALNSDGGYVLLEDGERKAFVMQTSEKVYVTYALEATDPGGHSSMPRPDNPVYQVARALAAQQEHRFPVDLNETTRAVFVARAEEATGEERELLEALVAGDFEDPVVDRLPEYTYYNALARTTCVATQLSGGHAENALPQTATGIVNCRILPQADPAVVEATLRDIVSPHGVTMKRIYEPEPSPPSPLVDEIVEPVTAVAGEMWPGIRFMPEMSTGATDGLFVRSAGIPVYGVSAIAEEPGEMRAHGQDERILIESFNEAVHYWYRLLKALTQP